MEMQVFLVAMSVVMLGLTAVLIVLLVKLSKSLASVAEILRSIEHGLQPVLYDLRKLMADVAQVSEGVKSGVEKVNRLAAALGSVGDDLETGRRAVKSAADFALNSFQPWLSKLKSIKSNFFNGTQAIKEIHYE